MASVCIITLHCPYEIKIFSLILIGLFLVLISIFFDVLLPSVIWKSHILRLLHKRLAKNLQEKLFRKEGDITVRDVRAKVTKRVEIEVEKARRGLD